MQLKRVSHKHNDLSLERYQKALFGHKDMATYLGFKPHKNKIISYEQNKLGLSTYYDKRWLLDDSIHTEPLEYHTDFCEDKTQEEELAELFGMSE